MFSFWLHGKEGKEDTSRSWSREHGSKDKYISKHFDFRLNGDIDGVDRQDDQDGYDHNQEILAMLIFVMS